MKIKFVRCLLECVCALVVLILNGCNDNNFESIQLLGIWKEKYHEKEMVKSISFEKNGILVYTEKPDTTWPTVIDFAGNYATLHYAVKENKLFISGNSSVSSSNEAKPFKFCTDYTINGSILSIDSFSYNGGIDNTFIKNMILYKQ